VCACVCVCTHNNHNNCVRFTLYQCNKGRCLSGIDCLVNSSTTGMNVTVTVGTQSATVVTSCCSANRLPAKDNPLCGQCLSGHYEWSGSCVEVCVCVCVCVCLCDSLCVSVSLVCVVRLRERGTADVVVVWRLALYSSLPLSRSGLI